MFACRAANRLARSARALWTAALWGAAWWAAALSVAGEVRAQPACEQGGCPAPSAAARLPEAARLPATARLPAAVVRVRAALARGEAQGSGVLIHAEQGVGLVLTAAHVLAGASAPRVLWSDGRASPAEVVCLSASDDVAALRVAAPADAAPLPLAGDDDWPRVGDAVELMGFGGGAPRRWSGLVEGYAASPSGRFHTLSVKAVSVDGDSGGPITRDGKVVAVLWGGPLAGPRGPMLAVHGTYCRRIRELLRGCGHAPPAAAPRVVAGPPGGDAAGADRAPALQNPPPAGAADCRVELATLRQEVARLQTQLAALERLPGPPGAAGKDGRDGRDARVDVDALAELVQRKLAGSLRIRVERQE